MRLFDKADPVAVRTGERSLDMAEKLAFKQRVRHCSAIHGHKLAVGAPGHVMNDPGKKFLSRPAFTADKHGRRGRCNFHGKLEHLLHGRASCHQIGEQPLLKLPVFGKIIDLCRQLVCHGLHVRRPHWFYQIKGRAVAQRFCRRVKIVHGGKDDQLGMRGPAFYIVDQVHFLRRHCLDVKKDDVYFFTFQKRECLRR